MHEIDQHCRFLHTKAR